MLKGAEYVDPILAEKIVNLERQLRKIQSTKAEILNNTALQSSTKSKLFKYQSQCEQNIERLLSQQKDKLAEYLDKQTTVITKENRKSQIHQHKNSFTLNQSTRIDLSTDDNKSFQATRKSETFTKSINSFNLKQQGPQNTNNKHFPNKHRLKLKRLKKRVNQQQKLINMLVLWVKIYNQREETYMKENEPSLLQEHKRIEQQNKRLKDKCTRLQAEIQSIKNDFRKSSQKALQSHLKREQIRKQNKQYQLQRKQLINKVRSLQKIKQKQKK